MDIDYNIIRSIIVGAINVMISTIAIIDIALIILTHNGVAAIVADIVIVSIVVAVSAIIVAVSSAAALSALLSSSSKLPKSVALSLS